MLPTNGDPLLDKVDRLHEWTRLTPGACHAGRAIGTDDPDRLGWDIIEQHAQEDGIFVFRHVPAETQPEIAARVGAWGFGLHSWRIFHGTADEIRARRRPSPTPAGYRIAVEAGPEPLAEVMDFLRRQGIAPLTVRTLSGEAGPVALVVARDEAGAIGATAFGYFGFNAHSPWHRTAWCGLVAVDEAARGAGLGRAVNDAAIEAMLAHGAEAIVEYAAEDNIPSRRMIEGSGLVMREDILTCGATRGGARHTR
ncbi:GNAT family N-acetyltransferase [Acuticoccus kandeliae]|uniref:GNAT family N-acetyltransferase n=1 Tax=Acuticoccus kandeliae TaxID=2073160 RepID=UPI001300A16C|nr:GNAT family N-acetyltransferase [Acuticoccus kandeliae]